MATDVTTLEMEQGATFRVSLTYTDANNAPISLVGYKAHMQVRLRVGAPVLIDLSTENGGIVLNGTSGVISVRGKASDTLKVTRNAVYDLHLISATDPEEVVRVFGGPVVLTKAVTVD